MLAQFKLLRFFITLSRKAHGSSLPFVFSPRFDGGRALPNTHATNPSPRRQLSGVLYHRAEADISGRSGCICWHPHPADAANLSDYFPDCQRRGTYHTPIRAESRVRLRSSAHLAFRAPMRPIRDLLATVCAASASADGYGRECHLG